MQILERIINHPLVKTYFVVNVILANLHVGLVAVYFLATGNQQSANLFHLLGIQLFIPTLGEERFLLPSYLAIAVLMAIVYRYSKNISIKLLTPRMFEETGPSS